jgi:hypothetical protein
LAQLTEQQQQQQQHGTPRAGDCGADPFSRGAAGLQQQQQQQASAMQVRHEESALSAAAEQSCVHASAPFMKCVSLTC